jgi:hypothetical protein
MRRLPTLVGKGIATQRFSKFVHVLEVKFCHSEISPTLPGITSSPGAIQGDGKLLRFEITIINPLAS